MTDSASVVRSILEEWDGSDLANAQWWLGLDCLLALSYSTALAFACLLVVPGPWPFTGRVGATAASLAGVVDIAENISLISVVHGGLATPLALLWMSKWVLFAIASLIALTALGFRLFQKLSAAGIPKEKRHAAAEAFRVAQSQGSDQVLQVSQKAPIAPPARSRLVDWFIGKRREPALPGRRPAIRSAERSVGVSCSGGGIRSAAYCLGALQVLDASGELDRTRYLSSVSGGSYIASAREIVRARPDFDTLVDERGRTVRPFAPGSPEEGHLRNRTTYLAPGLSGKWAFLWRLVRGLAVNLAIIVSAVALSGALYGALLVGPYLIRDERSCARKALCDFEIRGWALLLVIVLGVAGAGLGLISMLLRPSNGSWASAIESWSLRLLNAFLAAMLLLVVLPWVVVEIRGFFDEQGNQLKLNRLRLIGFGAAAWATVLGLISLATSLKTLLSVFRSREPPKTPISHSRGVRAAKRAGSRLGTLLFETVVAIVGPAAAAVLFVAYAFIGAYRGWSFQVQATMAVFALILFVAAAWFDLTRWSVYPYYKRRLSSVFALERARLPDDSVIAREVSYSYPMSFLELARRPSLVVCAAANVSDYGASPTSRHAVPFVFSADTLHGGSLLGDIEMSDYLASPAVKERDASIRAAVAMSGAAVSPSMGKHNRPWLRFLLAVANVRLGVWLPTPKAVRRQQEGGRRVPMRVGLQYLLWEIVGRHSFASDFVYVTDGGHVENLGLVELLRRGCTDIYCIDASGDKTDTFNTLSEAFAIARTELGVDILMDTFLMAPNEGAAYVEKECMSGQYWFVGDDRSSVAPGRLVVLKAGVAADAPSEIRAFMARDPGFPTHGTASQLYSEERFEAYRALGADAARRAIPLMEQAPAFG